MWNFAEVTLIAAAGLPVAMGGRQHLVWQYSVHGIESWYHGYETAPVVVTSSTTTTLYVRTTSVNTYLLKLGTIGRGHEKQGVNGLTSRATQGPFLHRTSETLLLSGERRTTWFVAGYMNGTIADRERMSRSDGPRGVGFCTSDWPLIKHYAASFINQKPIDVKKQILYILYSVNKDLLLQYHFDGGSCFFLTRISQP